MKFSFEELSFGFGLLSKRVYSVFESGRVRTLFKHSLGVKYPPENLHAQSTQINFTSSSETSFFIPKFALGEAGFVQEPSGVSLLFKRFKICFGQLMIASIVFQSFVPMVQAGCIHSKVSEEDLTALKDVQPVSQQTALSSQGPVGHHFEPNSFEESRIFTAEVSFKAARDFLIEKTLEPLLESYLKSLPRSQKKQQVFVSYAWPKKEEEREIQPFLLKLTSHLKRVGLLPTMDLLDLAPGSNITAFMEEGIRNSKSVLIIGSETYYTRSLEETPVRYEFEKVLQTAGKGMFVQYQGEAPEGFQKRLVQGRVQDHYDIRTPERYYQTVPVLLGKLLQGGRGIDLSSYTAAVKAELQSISDAEVRTWQQQLMKDAGRKKRAMALQVEALLKNLPEDERFNPQDWYIPARSPLFTGRKKELDKLQSYLVPGESRCIRIIGDSGIGKKALAYAYASHRKEMYEGSFAVQNLEELSKTLKVKTEEEMQARLKSKKQLLFIVDQKADQPLLDFIGKLDLPTHIVGLGEESLAQEAESISLSALTQEESLHLLEQGSGDLNHSEIWGQIAHQFSHHPESLTKVLQYYQENRIIDADNLLSVFKNQGFNQIYATWEPKKQLDKQTTQDALTQKVLRRQGTLRKLAQRITSLLDKEYYLKRQVLSPLIERALADLKGSMKEVPSIYLALLPEGEERHLLAYDQLSQDLRAIGFSPKYLLQEGEVQDRLYDVRGIQENSYVIVMGTPALEASQKDVYIKQFEGKCQENRLFLLTVDNKYGQFSDYSEQGQFISSVKTPENYAETLLRITAEMVLEGEKNKTFRQKYEGKIKTEV